MCTTGMGVHAVVITQYHTLAPKTAVRVKFHLLGKFQTDTCPRYFYHTSSDDNSFFSSIYCNIIATGSSGREIRGSNAVLPKIFVCPLGRSNYLIELQFPLFPLCLNLDTNITGKLSHYHLDPSLTLTAQHPLQVSLHA